VEELTDLAFENVLPTSYPGPPVAIPDPPPPPSASDVHVSVPLIEIQSPEPTLQETQEEIVTNVNHCLEEFKKAWTLAEAYGEGDGMRIRALREAYEACCSKTPDGDRFCVFVLRFLRDTNWPLQSIQRFFKPLRLPCVYTPNGLLFLQTLEQMSNQSHSLEGIYARLATEACSGPMSSSSNHDASLRLLVHGLWSSVRPQNPAYRGRVFSLVRQLVPKLSSQQLRRCLQPLLHTPNDNLHGICLCIDICTRDRSATQLSMELLECIPDAEIRSWIHSLSDATRRQSKKMASQTHLAFKELLRLLYERDKKVGNSIDSKSSMLAFRLLADAYIKDGSTTILPQRVVTALLYALAGHASFTKIPVLDFLAFVDSYTLSEMEETDLSLNKLLARLMAKLQDTSLPNHGVLELIIPILDEHTGLLAVTNLLEAIRRSGTTPSSTSFLQEYSQESLQRLDDALRSATNLRLQRYALELSLLRRIGQLQLAWGWPVTNLFQRIRTLQARQQLQHILDRANNARVIPLAYQKLTVDISPFFQKLLIHQFAEQYSRLRTRSFRENRRSIRYLYQYLVANDLKMEESFSKAVVAICLTRPMESHQFVSQRELIWICRLVEKVEGKVVAQQVENIFWEWRGRLIEFARQRLVKARGYRDRAHVSTMKRLQLLESD